MSNYQTQEDPTAVERRRALGQAALNDELFLPQTVGVRKVHLRDDAITPFFQRDWVRRVLVVLIVLAVLGGLYIYVWPLVSSLLASFR